MTNYSPGQVLDRLVAERVMGFRLMNEKYGMIVQTHPVTHRTLIHKGVPSYSTDLADAMRVAMVIKTLHGTDLTDIDDPVTICTTALLINDLT